MADAGAARTFLFSDIESSTRTWETHPDEMAAALETHDAILADAVSLHGGSIVKTTGDGVMAMFPEPTEALVAAVAMITGLAGADWADLPPLRIRVGIHSGDAQVRGDDFFGPTVNRAARIMSVASGGQILVSDVVESMTSGRLPSGLSFRDLGEHRLKDLGGAHRVFQLCGPGLTSSFPPVRTLDLTPNNLPSQVSELLGRERELAELRSTIDGRSTRLITLVGPGGTGKTRLGLHVAADQIDRYADGVYLIDLANVTDAQGVAPALARIVASDERSEDPPAVVVARAIGSRSILLLLDNFEHVLGAGTMIAGLLAACENMMVIVTSREALHVRGEQVYDVAPLGLPPPGDVPSVDSAMQHEAIELFVARAAAVDPSFTIDEANVADIVAICRRLDGLPLAIELAAARLRLFQPAELRERLDERLDVLRGGAADLPERQRALMSTIEWSYDLLTVHQRSLFRAFSAFAGASLDSVEGVADHLDHLDSALVLDDLESLVAKSLIRSERTPLGTRFSMLETIRDFARSRLLSDGEEDGVVRRAHATYYADLSNELRSRLQGPERERALALAAAGLGNLRAAWTFWVAERDASRLEELLETLWALHDAQGQYHGAIELANDMLDVLGVSPEAADQARAAALQMSVARAIMAIKGYTSEVEDAFTRALEMQEASGAGKQFPVLRSLASLYVLRAEMEKAASVAHELLEIAEADGTPIHLVDAHLMMGSTVGFVDTEQGLAHLDAAIEAFDLHDVPVGGLRLGPHPGVSSLCASAFFLWFLGHLDRADLRAARAVESARALDHPYSIAFALFHAALLDLWNHRIDRVAGQAAELLDLARLHRWGIWEAVATIFEGVIAVAGGNHDEGLATIEQGISLYEAASAPPIFWPLIMNIRSRAFLMSGRITEAEQMADTALAILPPDTALYIPSALAKGDILVARGDTQGAIDWVETANELGATLQLPTPALLALTRLLGLDPTTERVEAMDHLLESFVEGRDSPLVLDAIRVRGSVSFA